MGNPLCGLEVKCYHSGSAPECLRSAPWSTSEKSEVLPVVFIKSQNRHRLGTGVEREIEQNLLPHTHFEKNERRRRSLSALSANVRALTFPSCVGDLAGTFATRSVLEKNGPGAKACQDK